jgi:hypothetical protein
MNEVAIIPHTATSQGQYQQVYMTTAPTAGTQSNHMRVAQEQPQQSDYYMKTSGTTQDQQVIVQ